MTLLADIVIINANVITIAPQQPRAEALAISQGKFAAIGTTVEIQTLIGAKTHVMDLKGQTVVPGFIDAHLHVLDSGIWHVQAVDCDLRSISAIQSAFKQIQHRRSCFQEGPVFGGAVYIHMPEGSGFTPQLIRDRIKAF